MADRPDARRTLPALKQEWASCIRCELGQRRLLTEGNFIFGQGASRGIMFVGDGPGKDEEVAGLPFAGAKNGGALLRKILMQLGLTPEDYYLTNSVSCRSCAPQTDAEGQPIYRKNYQTKQMEPAYRDDAPTPLHIASCRPRLHEEIYLVDPTVIVGLGVKACEALTGKNITIGRIRGEPMHIAIPGAGERPLITKDNKWRRKVKGQAASPTEQNEVRYLLVPTTHPLYVMKELADQAPDSEFRKFVADIKKAIRIYEGYLKMVFGELPSRRVDLDEDEMQQQIQAQDED